MIPTPDIPDTLPEYVHVQLVANAPVVCALLVAPPRFVETKSGGIAVRIDCTNDFHGEWLVPFVESESQLRPHGDFDWYDSLRDLIGVDRADHVRRAADAFAEESERGMARHLSIPMKESTIAMEETFEPEPAVEEATEAFAEIREEMGPDFEASKVLSEIGRNFDPDKAAPGPQGGDDE